MSPRPTHHRRGRNALSYRVAALAILLGGGTLITAHAATNNVGGSNLEHITNLPGPPPQTTEPTSTEPTTQPSSSPTVTDAPPTTPPPASDPSASPPTSDFVTPPIGTDPPG